MDSYATINVSWKVVLLILWCWVSRRKFRVRYRSDQVIINGHSLTEIEDLMVAHRVDGEEG